MQLCFYNSAIMFSEIRFIQLMLDALGQQHVAYTFKLPSYDMYITLQ